MAPNANELECEMKEIQKLEEMQSDLAKTLELPVAKPKMTLEEQKEVDARSIYIGNVDWFSKQEDIEKHFSGCGPILRVTIPKDKRTQRQKNFAYVEFESVECVEMALVMNGSVFRNRPIVVTAKRTNIPGMSAHGAPKGARGAQRRATTTIVKYVYINGPARGAHGNTRGKRFTPY